MKNVTRNCERCGSSYNPNYASSADRGEQIYCSPACATAARFGDPVDIRCAACGGPVPKGDRKRVYCSMECRNIAKRGRPSPKRKHWDDYPAPLLDPETGCLRWQGPHHRNGYGLLGGDRRYAHREAWVREHGPIPDGLSIDHVHDRGCRWRDCVNTDHLEPVTQGVNVRRGEPANRTHCPQNHKYEGANLIIRRGKRECRTCVRARNAAAYRRRQAARKAAAT